MECDSRNFILSENNKVTLKKGHGACKQIGDSGKKDRSKSWQRGSLPETLPALMYACKNRPLPCYWYQFVDQWDVQGAQMHPKSLQPPSSFLWGSARVYVSMSA